MTSPVASEQMLLTAALETEQDPLTVALEDAVARVKEAYQELLPKVSAQMPPLVCDGFELFDFGIGADAVVCAQLPQAVTHSVGADAVAYGARDGAQAVVCGVGADVVALV